MSAAEELYLPDLTIFLTGDLYACRRFSSKVGNLFEERIADIWTCEMETYRKYTKFKKCATCELLAWCRGCLVQRGATCALGYAAIS